MFIIKDRFVRGRTVHNNVLFISVQIQVLPDISHEVRHKSQPTEPGPAFYYRSTVQRSLFVMSPHWLNPTVTTQSLVSTKGKSISSVRSVRDSLPYTRASTVQPHRPSQLLLIVPVRCVCRQVFPLSHHQIVHFCNEKISTSQLDTNLVIFTYYTTGRLLYRDHRIF